MALSEARENVKILDSAADELSLIAGQKVVTTKARKAISNFKLREGMPIGVMVTLRRERMWEFFDRLVSIALPRVRDFRGISDKAFDGRGNYSLGLREHTIFPELNLDKVEKVKGMTISITTTATSDFEGLTLLRALGMPFRSTADRDDSDGEDQPAGQSGPHAQVQGSRLQSLPALRTRARVLPALQDVSPVPAQECAEGRATRSRQGQLVGTLVEGRINVAD
jgi:large subunit ribosomal protein L5